MTHTPHCTSCDVPMTLVRKVPGWTYTPAVECFQCDCGDFEILHAVVEQVPVAGRHAQPHPTNYDATPGSGMFSDLPNLQPSG